jgi:hypothetical protein
MDLFSSSKPPSEGFAEIPEEDSDGDRQLVPLDLRQWAGD